MLGRVAFIPIVLLPVLFTGLVSLVDDGSFYFDEEHVDVTKYQGPLSTTAFVVRGLTPFADVSSGKINVS